MRQLAWALTWLCLTVGNLPAQISQEPDLAVGFAESQGQVVVNVAGHAIATYVYQDAGIRRPYFAHVQAPGGIQVTRNHPPQSGDRDDHATMHPGIWLAFGDINGFDFWRNEANIEHVKFVQPPQAAANTGSFTQLKHYVAEDGTIVCNELFRFELRADAHAYLFQFDSLFTSDHEFYFGDQEEMGWGMRVATPISEVAGGKLLDSNGRQGAKDIWSQSSAWCDYSGLVKQQSVGMTIMNHPSNFRASWHHARNYGLVVANPFGRSAMQHGDKSRIVVEPSESLRLRYAVWIHAGSGRDAIEAAYREYGESQ